MQNRIKAIFTIEEFKLTVVSHINGRKKQSQSILVVEVVVIVVEIVVGVGKCKVRKLDAAKERELGKSSHLSERILRSCAATIELIFSSGRLLMLASNVSTS